MKTYFDNKEFKIPFSIVSKIEEFEEYVKVHFCNNKAYFRIEQMKDYNQWKELNKEGKKL